jgi:hypothetical protein
VNLPPVAGERITKEIEFIYELIVALGMGSEYYGTLPPENEEQIGINYVSACTRFGFWTVESIFNFVIVCCADCDDLFS